MRWWSATKWYQIHRKYQIKHLGGKKKTKGNYPTVLKATGFLILLSEQLPTQACEIDAGKKERSENAAARITLNSTGQPERWNTLDEPATREAVGLGLSHSMVEATSMARRIPVHWSCVVENVISAKKQENPPEQLPSLHKWFNKKNFKLPFTQTLITPTVLFAVIPLQSHSIWHTQSSTNGKQSFHCLPWPVPLQGGGKT